MNRLRELRGNDTQEQIAKKLGLNRQTYRNYENETRQPDFDTLLRIADFFNVTLDYLLGRDLRPKATHEKAASPLSEKETRLIAAFNELIPPMQDYILEMTENLVQKQESQNSSGSNSDIKRA